VNFENTTWQMTTIFNIGKSPYINNCSKIWYTTADLELDDSEMTKCKKIFNTRQITATLKIVFWP